MAVAVLPTPTSPERPTRLRIIEARENEWVSLRPLFEADLTPETERLHREEIRVLGERLKRDLTLRQAPLGFEIVSGDPRLRISGVAGTLNLWRDVTIQISPKFAGVGAGAA